MSVKNPSLSRTDAWLPYTKSKLTNERQMDSADVTNGVSEGSSEALLLNEGWVDCVQGRMGVRTNR